MSAPPYMKLYWGDYSRKTRHLKSAAEHGAYLMLIGALWDNGGKLPADDATLASHALCTPDEWDALKPKIMPFFDVRRGKLSNSRVTDELADYESTIRKRKEAGKAGGTARAENQRENGLASAKQTPGKSPHNQQQQSEPVREDIAADDRGREASDPIMWPPSEPPDGAYINALGQALRGVAGACLNTTSTKLFVLAPILSLGKPGDGPPCDFISDVLPAVRACAARAPPGSVRSWDYFVPAIREARDRRLRGAPAEGPIHANPSRSDDKLARKQANLARSLAGFDRVAGSRERP